MRENAPRRRRLPFAFLLILVLSTVGCSTLGGHRVVINERADPRLDITVRRGLFTARARIGHLDAGPFVIDSGADRLYLDAQLAKALNPSSWDKNDATGSQPKVKWGLLATFEIGPMALHNTVVGVTDFSAASASFGERLAGLLGYPFFAKAVVEVDYPQHSISCFEPTTYRLPRGQWQPLTLIGNRPTVAARLEGNIEGQFLVDTGNTSTVLLLPEFVEKHGLLRNRDVVKVKHTNVMGEVEYLAGRIAWFEFAGHRFDRPIVQLNPPAASPGLRPEFAGIIG
jgi:hypothetical protein